MKPKLQFSLPSSMRPVCTEPQYNRLCLMREKGWEFFAVDNTILLHLEQKGFVERRGLKAYLTAAGKSIIAPPVK